MVAESDLIEYRWLNMDNRCYTTDVRLYQYARMFPRGEWKCEAPKLGGPCLTAYGIRPYTFDDVRALDARLSAGKSGE